MYAAALTTSAARELVDHLDRADGQEDLCFAIWRPSQGRDRLTALLAEPILPREGERRVHGNVSFAPGYYQRALGVALAADAGLAFLHSHPSGRGWQGMSQDDFAAEAGKAAQTLSATGLPLVGVTLGTGDGSWSARFWPRSGPRRYEPQDCEAVRVVGERLQITYDDEQRLRPVFRPELTRTVSAWGEDAQTHLARLRIGIVGAGSVGALVAEALARTGIERFRLIDFDAVETVNLDRLVHATRHDIKLSRSKVETLARGLRRSATATQPQIEPLELSIVEEDGFRAALDCDVLFSCVDRPWARYVLNLIAYAHLIPIVDGGIAVERTRDARLRGASWRAHVAAPERRCLECLEQYDAGLIQTERDGFLDDPKYIERLPDDHPLKRNENVFAFSAGCAALELNQFLSMVLAPGGVSDFGAQRYHLASGTCARDERGCRDGCLFSGRLLGLGDQVGFTATGRHAAATKSLQELERRRRSISVRARRALDDFVARAMA
jgi:hypothetical protein